MNRTHIVRAMAFVLALALCAGACRKTRSVKLAWDVPATAPNGYRIWVDDDIVMDIPPPPLDPSCRCPSVTITVPRGHHTLKVIAYNQSGESPPSAIVVVE